MKREDFIAASTSTRIYEDDLLKAHDLEGLNDYESLSEVLNALNDSSYASAIAELDRDEEYEKILIKELVKVYEKIADVTPDKNISQYLIEKYNFHNLKLLVKEIIQEEDYSKIYSPMANVDTAFIKRELLKSTDEEENFASVGKKDDREIYLAYAQKALKAYEESQNPAMIDISLDKSYYERELALAEATEIDSLLTYTKEAIDLVNIKTLLRIRGQKLGLDYLKNALIDGGNLAKDDVLAMISMDVNEILSKTSSLKVNSYLKKSLDRDKNDAENLLDLEKAIDDHFMDFAKNAKSMTYGPEVLLGFLIAKEQEIKNLRIIFISKLNSLPKDFTRERLRETYV
ncbi:V-type ATPase subunit [uncultured Anaerococcus sp.]|uniref:V-type ATPase subunit n=1 Tax=uncultured Anaerococcus sp. TaxID=293428 RepID=UPI002889E35D|nr:V-type ATPase subunit [uncultured Anaerococcus sp.]